MIDNDRITQIALDNGFKLKEQPDGSMALNPYVFDFARALIREAVSDICDDLGSEVDQVG